MDREAIQKAALKRRFRRYDANGDGTLNMEEMAALLREGDPNMTDRHLRLLFKGCDTDGSGVVEFDEFVEFLFSMGSASAGKKIQVPPKWFAYARAGNLDGLSRLLDKADDPTDLLEAQDDQPSETFPCCNGLTAAMYAATSGHESCVEFLADRSADLNAKDSALGMTALMMCADRGLMAMLRLLVERGADVDLGDNTNLTALMLAMSARQERCLGYLVKRGVDLDAQDEDGWSAAMLAAQAGAEASLRQLLVAKANPDLRNEKRQTALMLAVMSRSEVCVRSLVQARASVMLKDWQDETAASVAQRLGIRSCQKMLQRSVAAGQGIMAMLGGGRKAQLSEEHESVEASQAWLDAAWHGRLEELDELAGQEGAEPSARGPDGWTAATVTSILGKSECLDLLIRKGADVNDRDQDKLTAAMWAANEGHLACLQVLAEHKADLNAQDPKKGLSAVTLAAEAGEEGCLRYLCECGADFDAKRKDGSTAALLFLLATGESFQPQQASGGQSARLSDLRSGERSSQVRPPSPDRAAGGALPLEECKSPTGGATRTTSWIRAAKLGRVDVLEKLADEGVGLDTVSSRGMTALMIVARRGHLDALKFLLQSGADSMKKERLEGICALGFAARHGHFECIKDLIDKGDAYLDDKDDQGRTALMEACLNGHERCVRLLLRRGADANIKAEDSKSVAIVAAECGQKECLRILAEYSAELIVRSSNANVLHILERKLSFEEARSVVPDIDWFRAASGGAAGLCEALASGDAAKHVPGLHFHIWMVEDWHDDWDKAVVRDPETTASATTTGPQLVEALFKCLEELLVASKELKLDHLGKQVLSMLLEAGLKRALDEESSRKLAELNQQVLAELEERLVKRQGKLVQVATLTDSVDTYFERPDRHGKTTSGKLDQRDAMPEELWGWLVTLPEGCVERLEQAHLCFKKLGMVTSSATLANYFRDHGLLNDSVLYAKASAHVLVGYAAIVDQHFKLFMKEHFGKDFKAAPIKKLPRIFTKLRGDIPQLADDFKTAEDPELRCSYFALGDAVRGSVEAKGAEAMVDTIERLAQLNKLSTHGRFDVWRIKNTHHADADETTGGYRDVKVLGKFMARKRKGGEFPLPISMIVEVQVIDTVYMDIKKYMHKAYSIDRGDFG